ncbi:hypothetical protein [Paenibacillus macquariensis]|uniref:Flagellin, Flp1-like, domain n=1 Tax=Paenibacillus macquariensis TaxID=948756 RepID=A0ABY1KEH1_9BACL|nr:hypothetical protein [Paenibacillus macquariensis]OAB30515.1 hypothetical protein PMSM_22750 [Paenibacillus macquariensis subsp. macquariensis]SIR71188.1 hypothetical protein SAMN05421578_1409 [Paenibacillus macquariensis]
MLKKNVGKVKELMIRKVYTVANQKGQSNVGTMLWILGGVLLFVVVLGLVQGWLPELMEKIKGKINGLL